MSQRPVIELRDCSACYGPVTVLRGINLKVAERETLCLVGPNGGGKSTLLKLILGLKQPSAGTIEVLGTQPAKARARIGYMPQHVQLDPLFPVDVASIIRMGRLNGSRHWWYSAADRKATERVIAETGLQAHRHKRFSELSGGLKQRVLIARALVSDPQILLLDEPTAMVDAEVGAQLLEQLQRLHRRITMVLVSHDTAFVSGLVDEVLCVNQSAELHPLKPVEDAAIERVYGAGAQAVLHQHGHHHHTGACDHG